MTIILKENNEAIRQKISDAGIRVCTCAKFVDACWLDFNPGVTDEVHGVGYYGEEVGTKSQEEELARFMAECAEPIFCKNVNDFIRKIKKYREVCSTRR